MRRLLGRLSASLGTQPHDRDDRVGRGSGRGHPPWRPRSSCLYGGPNKTTMSEWLRAYGPPLGQGWSPEGVATWNSI